MAGKQKSASLSFGYFPGLDVLRFICAAGVIFHHTAQQLFQRGLVQADSKSQVYSGAFFLNVFFIISGFLIGGILKKEVESGTYSLKNFYLRRIIRIWPLYFLTVLLLIIIAPMVKGAPPDLIKTNALYAAGFAVNFQLLFDHLAKTYVILWSVCIEEHIYIVLPFLLLLFQKNFKVLGLGMALLGITSWLFFSYKQHNSNGYNPYFISLCYFYYFGLGVLLAAFEKKINSIGALWNKGTQSFTFLLLFLYVFNFCPAKMYETVWWLLINGLFGVYLVMAVGRSGSILSLKPSTSRFLGNISYALYLFHIMIINIVIAWLLKKNAHPGDAIASFWLPVLITCIGVALSALLHYLYEKPFLKLKKKYTTISNK